MLLDLMINKKKYNKGDGTLPHKCSTIGAIGLNFYEREDKTV